MFYLNYLNYSAATIQLIKSTPGIDSSTIGINLWLAPQISEHCPKKIPGR
jgi:hypothetical protein